MQRLGKTFLLLAVAAAIVAGPPAAQAQQDPYETYIKTSKDFERVKQDKDWALEAWPSWTYMPWTWRWHIGYTDESGRWSREHGYNGAFLDHGRTRVDGADKLAWINKFRLRFYMDHTAGKGYLYVRKTGSANKAFLKKALPSTGYRKPLLDEATMAKCKDLCTRYINNVKSSPFRAGYALDDEISWGSFVRPCFWQITKDRAAYEKYLKDVYGAGNAPDHKGWVNYDAVRPRLSTWRVQDFDCSQVMDQLAFNDTYWANFLGELVEHCNQVDPATPVGFVGGQQASPFGGYDYAKLMRKIQFIEAYDYGDSQAVIRSMNPRNALPQVTTHFHKRTKDTIWQTWYYLAQGNRGHIGWVAKWFDGKEPKGFHDALAPHYLEAGNKIGPLVSGAEWIDDGVAVYYSHPSIQFNWMLDAESHGKTWPNRNTDATISTFHLARTAWLNMLRDEGVQFTMIDYVSVIKDGVPEDVKVLILPAVTCLSDAEAEKIKAFCKAGGTVIADFLPGLWDQHGRGRDNGGVLDDMFGVKHDPNMRAGDVFQKKLWAEVNQDHHYKLRSYEQHLGKNTSIKHESGFNKAVRKMDVDHVNRWGQGRAVMMNLSPVWYMAYRVQGIEPASRRRMFMKHVTRDVQPWVRVGNASDANFGYEITYWKKGDRTILFVINNAERRANMLGGGNAVGLKTDEVKINLVFDNEVRNVRDERAGKDLGSGKSFNFDWKMNEAVVLSFDGAPPR
jgi:hypothetical protein